MKNDTQRWNHRGWTDNSAQERTFQPAGTLHWLLQTCCGPPNTWEHQDFIAKLKAGVGGTRAAPRSGTGSNLSPCPCGDIWQCGCVWLAVIAKEYEHSNVIQDTLSLELLFLLASQKMVLPHANRKKGTTGMALKLIHCISKGTAAASLENQHHVHSSFPGCYNWFNASLAILWGPTEVITGLGRGCCL